jgi:hypothetical protein
MRVNNSKLLEKLYDKSEIAKSTGNSRVKNHHKSCSKIQIREIREITFIQSASRDDDPVTITTKKPRSLNKKKQENSKQKKAKTKMAGRRLMKMVQNNRINCRQKGSKLLICLRRGVEGMCKNLLRARKRNYYLNKRVTLHGHWVN